MQAGGLCECARMAPRMNEVISLARDHGVAIIHAPSSGMKYYEDTPYRETNEEPHARLHLQFRFRAGVTTTANTKVRGLLSMTSNAAQAKVTGCDDPVGHAKRSRRIATSIPTFRSSATTGSATRGRRSSTFLEQEKGVTTSY